MGRPVPNWRVPLSCSTSNPLNLQPRPNYTRDNCVAHPFQSGKVSAPAVLIEGKAVSYGVPTVEQMKSALLEAGSAKTTSK